MTKPETALSAVVERTFPLSEFGDDLHDYLQRGLRDVLYADLTALISEGYYPKEFTEWLVKNSLPEGNCVLVRARLVKTELLTYDEAFKYWKENEQ